MAFDSTLSGPNANSNLSIARAEELLEALPQSDGIAAWLTFTDEEKGKTLTAATLVMDSQEWRGSKCRCEQNLSFPRLIQNCSTCDDANCNKIPYKIELATAYLAAYIGPSGGFMGVAENDGIGALGIDGLDPFSEVQIGPLKVKMKDQGTNDKSLASLTGSLPPFVAELIRPYLSGGMDGEIMMDSPSVARFQRRRNYGSNYTGFYDIGATVRPRSGNWG
jgi:hypothetical protein